MVHYIFTPWRDRRELLAVRRQFYPRGASSFAAVFTGADAVESNAVRREAVARVTVWMQRGFCPHMIESTALLTAAILADASSTANNANSAPVAARAAYASAFARFVTGLLDGQQDRARKMSMHGLAQHIGLPAGFVELRHQVTHEALPSLRRLRSASQQALAWIYDYYWAGVGDAGQGAEAEAEAESAEVADELPGRASLQKALQRCVNSDALLTSTFIARWGEVRLLSELSELAARASADDAACARIRQLSQAVLQWGSTGQTGHTDTAAKPVSRKRPRTEANTSAPGPDTPLATAAAATTTTTTTTTAPAPAPAPAKMWTMANLDLAAVRASLARNRQALSKINTEDKTKEKNEVEDKDVMEVDEAEVDKRQVNENGDGDDDQGEAHEDSEAEVEVPAKRPRWTRFTGTWTPRPIGVV